MATIEKRLSPRMAKLQRALAGSVEEIRKEGREFGLMAKSEFGDLAGQARQVFARDCVRVGNELTKLGRKLQGRSVKPVRRIVRKAPVAH